MKNILSKFSFSQYTDIDKSKWYPHAQRDWAVIFYCAVIVAISFLLFHASLYLNMRVESFFAETQTLQENRNGSINRKGLVEVISDFVSKKKQFDAIMMEPITITDPSKGIISSQVSIPTSSSKMPEENLLSQ